MSNRIDIPDWFQLDFDINTPRNTLQSIAKLMKLLEDKKLIDKWFYLFEGKTIRVRMHSTTPKDLEKTIKKEAAVINLTISSDHPFESYWETTDAFDDVDVVKTFADIISSLTGLTITRLDGKQIINYRLAERLLHCIYNNTYGLPTEEYFLLKRLLERYGSNLDSLNDNPEQTVLDDQIKVAEVKDLKVTIPTLKVPIK